MFVIHGADDNFLFAACKSKLRTHSRSYPTGKQGRDVRIRSSAGTLIDGEKIKKLKN